LTFPHFTAPAIPMATSSPSRLRGRYVSASGATNAPAFVGLYFSESAGFAPFSHMTISTEGEHLSYHRGDDHIRTVEFAVLQGWQAHGIQPDSWSLYPREHVEDSAFLAAAREAYWESRRRLCLVLYATRALRWAETQFGVVAPLFRYEGAMRHLRDGEADNEEIWEAVQAVVRDATDAGDPECA
jgi:hypothetical protein